MEADAMTLCTKDTAPPPQLLWSLSRQLHSGAPILLQSENN